jgi:hypothetical protein
MFVSTRQNFLPDLAKVGKTRPDPRHQPGMTINHLAPEGHCCAGGPPVDVVTWRLCRLLESGFAQDLAQRLASTRAVDVHALLQLVDRGCPPELAARILSPVATPWGSA